MYEHYYQGDEEIEFRAPCRVADITERLPEFLYPWRCVLEYVGYESGDICTLYSFAMLTVIKFCFELPIVFLHLFLARFCVSVYVA